MKKMSFIILAVICCIGLIGCDSSSEEKNHNYYVVELKKYNDDELKKLENFGYIKEEFKIIQTVTLEVKENKLKELQKENNIKKLKKAKKIKEIEKKQKRYAWIVDIKKEKSDSYIHSLSNYGEILEIDKKLNKYSNSILILSNMKNTEKMFKEKELNSIYRLLEKEDPNYQEIYAD